MKQLVRRWERLSNPAVVRCVQTHRSMGGKGQRLLGSSCVVGLLLPSFPHGTEARKWFTGWQGKLLQLME